MKPRNHVALAMLKAPKRGSLVHKSKRTTQVGHHRKDLDMATADHEREKIAKWMIDRSYATGHGDTIEDLLKELEWQIRESEREACAKVAESYEPRCDTCPSGVANAIRARGKHEH